MSPQGKIDRGRRPFLGLEGFLKLWWQQDILQLTADDGRGSGKDGTKGTDLVYDEVIPMERVRAEAAGG